MDGIYHKYDVYNASSGERIQNCFVMRPGSDRAAVVALRAYAKATENRELAADITKWVGEGEREPNRVLTETEIENMNGEPVWIDTMGEWRIVVADTGLLLTPGPALVSPFGGALTVRHVIANRGIIMLRKPTDQERAAVPWERKS